MLISFLIGSQITFYKPDKWHLLINTDENVILKIKNETITKRSNQKLLGTLFNNKFHFDEHVTLLCRKVSQKLNALARVGHYMNLAQYRFDCMFLSCHVRVSE